MRTSIYSLSDLRREAVALVRADAKVAKKRAKLVRWWIECRTGDDGRPADPLIVAEGVNVTDGFSFQVRSVL